MIAGIRIQQADELARVIMDGILTALKGVDLFDDRDGDDNVVFLEMKDAGGVMEDDVGVEDKYFLHRQGLPTSEWKI